MSSLCQLLLDKQMVSMDAIDAVLSSQAHRGDSVETELLARGVLSERQLHGLLGEVHALEPGPSGGPIPVDSEAKAMLPAVLARHFFVVPLERREGKLWLATSSPLSEKNRSRLSEQVGLPIVCVIVSDLRIRQALADYFDGQQLEERYRTLLERMDGDDVSLEVEVPPSSRSPRSITPSAQGSATGDWYPLSSRSSGPISGPVSSQSQPESTRFRHRGPLSREQAERAIERASDVRIVLQILTRYARQFVDLSVVFVVRRGVATARESDGWTYEPVHVELGAGGTLGDVSESQTARLARFEPLGVDATVRDALGVEDHAVVVVPLTIRGRTVALFLGADRDADVEEEVVDEIRDFSQRVAGALARIIIETKKKG